MDQQIKTEKHLSTNKLQIVTNAAQNNFTNHVVAFCYGGMFSPLLSCKVVTAFAVKQETGEKEKIQH